MKIVLTVDFDFFVREEMMWDWQHSESLGDWIWQIRASGLLRSGIDPESLIQSDPDTFIHRLQQRGVSFDKCQVFGVADSHAHGASFYQTMAREFNGRKSLPILNFDAHHDLGYNERRQLSLMVARNQVEAGSWAWPLIVGRPKQKYTVVYPEWKGRRELELSDLPLNKTELERCSFLTEPEWFGRPKERLEVAGFLAVRSGAWTPPWLDPVWIRFLKSATTAIGALPIEWPPGRIHDPSVLDLRPWDWSSANQLVALHTMQLAQLTQQMGIV